MKRADVVQQRVSNQRLAYSEFEQPVQAVRWLGAVQAQDFFGAKWALALRMVNATYKTIEEAFNCGAILRTHVMRPTWHFVAPEDIRWLLALTAPRVNVRCAPNYRNYELDDATFRRSNKVLTKALAGGKHMTRTQIKAALNGSGVAADDGVRLAHILLRAELDGLVCSGPRIGKQFTYALLEERVAPAKPVAPEEALAKLTLTYFRSHGPASLNDFVWWSGLTAGDARKGLASVESNLEEARLNGTVYWSGRFSQTDPRPKSQDVHLLPAFDEYNVAYKHREALAGVAPLSPTLVLKGQVVGNWKPANMKNSVTLAVTTARSLTQAEKLAVSRAADRYGAYLGLPVHVIFEDVPIDSHAR